MAERSKALESGHLSHLVRKGVGSNPTSVILTFFQTYLLNSTMRVNFSPEQRSESSMRGGRRQASPRGKAELERARERVLLIWIVCGDSAYMKTTQASTVEIFLRSHESS